MSDIVYHDRLPATTEDGEPIEYRDDPGSKGHAVGDDGSVWSRIVKGSKIGTLQSRWRKLKCRAGKNGYPVVNFRRGGKKMPHTVHTLVLEAFVGPRPAAGMECRHKDGNPLNNRASNLAWGTYEEQAADKLRHGTLPQGEAVAVSRLDPLKIRAVRALRAAGFTLGDVGQCLGVHESTIRSVLKGDTWQHVAAPSPLTEPPP